MRGPARGALVSGGINPFIIAARHMSQRMVRDTRAPSSLSRVQDASSA